MNFETNTMIAVLISILVLFVVGRQFMRQWNRDLIADANRKLRLPVPEIQYTNRRDIIERLLDDEELKRRIAQQVEATGLPAATLHRRCRRYAKEIVPAFSAVFYFRVGYWLSRVILLSLYRVHVHIEDRAAMDAIKPGSSVVLMMNHRSNMDILLVTYLASRRSTLINTAGEWARMWPLKFFVHWAGSGITDRDAEDGLYKYLYKAFIQMAVRERANIGIYPEGELSRDGKMRQSKFGLLSYCVTANPETSQNLYLIPVGLNYDRIPEEDQLTADADAVYRRQGRLKMLVSFIYATLEYLVRFLLPKRAQFGNACASFGRPIALADWQAGHGIDVASDDHRKWVTALGNELIQDVSRLIPVMPSHVLATLLLSEGNRDRTLQDIQKEAGQLLRGVSDCGRVVCFPVEDNERAIADAVKDFSRRKLLLADASGQFTVNPEKVPLLRLLANSVSHLLGCR